MDALTRLSAWMTPYAVVWVVGLGLGVAGCKGNQGGQTLPPPVAQAEALAEDVQDDLDRAGHRREARVGRRRADQAIRLRERARLPGRGDHPQEPGRRPHGRESR